MIKDNSLIGIAAQPAYIAQTRRIVFLFHIQKFKNTLCPG